MRYVFDFSSTLSIIGNFFPSYTIDHQICNQSKNLLKSSAVLWVLTMLSFLSSCSIHPSNSIPLFSNSYTSKLLHLPGFVALFSPYNINLLPAAVCTLDFVCSQQRDGTYPNDARNLNTFENISQMAASSRHSQNVHQQWITTKHHHKHHCPVLA